MFGKKIKPDELEEIRKRTELINQYIMIAQALEVQKQVYLRSILPKYGLDMNKNYEIDVKTGKIKLAKPKGEKQ